MSITRKDLGEWVVGDMKVLDDLTIEGAVTIAGTITITGGITCTLTGGANAAFTASVTGSEAYSGWALGFYGSTTLTSPSGNVGSAAGGVFEVNMAAAFSGATTGVVTGLFVGAYGNSTADNPTAGLWLETIAGTGVSFQASGAASDMPMLALVTSGAGTKSSLAIEFGSEVAAKTVTTTSGGMFYNGTIQMKANGTLIYMVTSTAEGTYTTAYPIITTNATASTTTGTGAVVITGGLGVGGATFITDLNANGATILLDGSTSVRGISAAFTSLESPANRFGSDASWYMQIATTATSGITAITHTGSAPAVTWTATSLSFVGNFDSNGATAALDGSTSVRGISAGFTSLESPANRLGLNATEYIQFETAVTTGVTTITHTGSGPTVTWTADSFDFVGPITLDAVTTSGKMAFGGVTDWGTGATGVLLDGTGYDWASQTIARVNADGSASAYAAAYHALTVTASQTASSSFFGTWTELYFSNSVDLTGADNNAAVWGQVEAGTNVTFFDTGCFTAGVYANVKAGATMVVGTGHSINGVRAQLEVAAVTMSGKSAAFECLKNGGVNWDYGLYIADATTGIAFAAATDILIQGNTIASLEVYDGTTKLLAFDTRNTVSGIEVISLTPGAATLPDGAASTRNGVVVKASTSTLVGTTQVTTAFDGLSFQVEVPTIAQSGGAVTVDKASTMYIAGPPTAGGSVTITAPYALEIGGGNFITAGDVYISGGNLAVGADAAAGTIELYPGTTNLGTTTITMTDNTGDTITNINVAAQGGARTYTVPDAGASAAFLMTDSYKTWWPFAIGLAGEDTDGAATNGAGIAGGVVDLTTHTYNDGAYAAADVMCLVYDVDTTTWEDLKASSSLTHWTANYQFQPDAGSEAAGDAFAIGMATRFCEIVFTDLSTGAGAVATYSNDAGKWQYSTGAGTWSDLTVFDNTDSTAQDGLRTLQRIGALSFAPPSDWASATYDTDKTGYWIQWVCTAAEITACGVAGATSVPCAAIPNADAFDVPFKATIGEVRATDMGIAVHDQVIKFVVGNFTTGIFSQEFSWTASQYNDTFTPTAPLAVAANDIVGICITDDTASTENPVIQLELEATYLN